MALNKNGRYDVIIEIERLTSRQIKFMLIHLSKLSAQLQDIFSACGPDSLQLIQDSKTVPGHFALLCDFKLLLLVNYF